MEENSVGIKIFVSESYSFIHQIPLQLTLSLAHQGHSEEIDLVATTFRELVISEGAKHTVSPG